MDITLAKEKYRAYKPTRVMQKKGGNAGKKSKHKTLRPRRRSWGPVWSTAEDLR